MRRSAAAVLGILVLAAGCGGGGGQRLSRDAYVAKADAICRTANAQTRKLRAPTTVAGIPAYVDRALPVLDSAIGRLRALRPPANLEPGVKNWLGAVGDARGALAAMRTAAQQGDTAKASSEGAAGASANRRANALAGSLGLTDCARA
jgi:hypothetical protein